MKRATADLASAVAAGALDALWPGERPLVVDDPARDLEDALISQGAAPELWMRRLNASRTATAWPPPGPFTSAFVRLPKAKDALDFALHAAASVVAPGGQIVLFGANDEGIRSASTHLDAVVDTVTTVDTRRHCRVLSGPRRGVIADHKSALADWRRQGEVTISGKPRRWVSYPGLFAGGGLDAGTALLLDHLPGLPANARALDFGSGTGIVAASLLDKGAGTVDLLDADVLALEAGRENVPGARLLLGDGLDAVGSARYDAILSNPPIHDGVAEHHGTLERLIAEAPRHLKSAGVLQIVVQRRVKASELMQAAFGNVAVVGETTRYRVLRSSTAPATR